MSERFKPEISVVRRGMPRNWVPDDGLFPDEPRALLIRGVPMVGERVNDGSRFDATVEGHIIWLVLRADNGEQFAALATRCSPARTADAALVERVAEAIHESNALTRSKPGELYHDLARAAIRAMKEGER